MFERADHNNNNIWSCRAKSNVVLVSDDRSLMDNTKFECQFLAQCQCFHYHYFMIQMDWVSLQK